MGFDAIMPGAFKATEVVQCDGVDYTLAIDIEIIDGIEDACDLGFDKVVDAALRKGRIGKVALLLRGLLSRHHPDLTLEDVASMIQAHGEAFGLGAANLISKASPNADAEAKAENPRKAHHGTGASSSSHGARPASRRATSGAKHLEPSS